MTVTNPAQTNTPAELTAVKSVRLHYLDWLRVLAILGVFLFHSLRAFDEIPWWINNAERCGPVTLFIVFFLPWGMPLFFFLSGAGTWFALRRRTARQYTVERIQRLLVPFVVGCLLLTPIQLYFHWLHMSLTGAFVGTLWEFFLGRKTVLGPRVFSWAGYHLWFLGFLFTYSVVALPLFMWFKKAAGQRTLDWLARLGQRRGGLLLFVIPLVVLQLVLRPFFAAYQDWADFVNMLVFFVYGYILFADERFAPAVRRDWPLALATGVLGTLFVLVGIVVGVAIEWRDSPGTPGFYLFWSVWSIIGWCWTLFMLYVGIRYLDFTNKRLVYGRESILPFYLLHQPVIIGIAFFVVQWDAGLMLKILVVVLGSLLVTLGLVELVIKRINVLRGLFGIKTRRRGMPSMETGHGSELHEVRLTLFDSPESSGGEPR
jgi:peptidoglycan/LPS O-acetylase OafA/YrhL